MRMKLLSKKPGLFLISCFVIFTIHFFLNYNIGIAQPTYPIVGTGQEQCYGDKNPITAPNPGENYYGQDAQFESLQPAYKDNGDGTISDLNTGLMWVKARGEKIAWNDAVAGASNCNVGAYNNWRMPMIKELYSLINFTGKSAMDAVSSIPYLDTDYFEFEYGDE